MSRLALSIGIAVVLASPAGLQAQGPPPIRIGGDIRAPAKIKDARPVYPPEARLAGASGIVFIEAVIDTEGRVASAKVTRSAPMFDQAALDAVRQWEYTPTLVNGTPVSVVMTVTVNFTVGAGRVGTPPLMAAAPFPGPPRVPAYDLTGEWTGDDGSVYEVRTVADDIFWFGRNDLGGWTHVFHGYLGANGSYSGRWVDVPPGKSRNAGTITIRVVTTDHMELVAGSDNFTARTWRRVRLAPAPAGLPARVPATR